MPNPRPRGRRQPRGRRCLRCGTYRGRSGRPGRTACPGPFDLRRPDGQALAASAVSASGPRLHALDGCTRRAQRARRRAVGQQVLAGDERTAPPRQLRSVRTCHWIAFIDLFLAMGRILPDDYPADGDLDDYLELEHRLGRVLRLRRDPASPAMPLRRVGHGARPTRARRPPRRRRSRRRLATGGSCLGATTTRHRRTSAEDAHGSALGGSFDCQR